jgi:hypothetical protein
MTRTVLALVVLAQRHHIEGVCRPWSAATLAARAAAERAATVAADLLAKTRQARAERAVERNAERVARAQQAQAAVQAGRQPAGAINPPPVVVDGFVIRVEQEQRR